MISKTHLFLLLIINLSFKPLLLARNLPNWVDNMNEYCKKNEICAVGSGKTRTLANIDAKNNIQKIFETKIYSKFYSTLSNNNNKISEKNYENISEETNGVLYGIRIEKTFYDNKNIYYSLAILEKSKTAERLFKEIEKIDNEMLIIFKNKKSIQSGKLEKLYNEREKLNYQYMFITNKSIKNRISIEDINNYKKNNIKNIGFYKVKINELYDATIINKVKTILSYNNINIVENNNFNNILDGDITMTKQFLNVDGFEKYKIDFYIKNIDSNNKIISSLNFNTEETGRSKEQVYNKAINKIVDFIENNLENLIK